MNITVVRGEPIESSADAIVLGAFAGTQTLTGLARKADAALGGLLQELVTEERFGGKEGDRLIVHTHGKIAARRIVLVGLGDRKTFSAESLRRALGVAVKTFAQGGVQTATLPLLGVGIQGVDASASAQASTEGALLAEYAYLAFKPAEAKRRKKEGIRELRIVENDASLVRAGERGVARGVMFARGVMYARDLVNEPASRMTPSHLRDHAQSIARSGEGVRLKVLGRAECERMGMGAYLSVARGSEEEPYFLHLIFRPSGGVRTLRRVAIVGKGITFDSGGLSLKPSEHMETMKCDMAGAAAVLGVFSVIADLAPRCEVHGIIAATENMPGARASKPGDMVTAMNGKSIEILNTDAEGRLALADCLSYAQKRVKPDVLVDLATLTGACTVALGPDIAGLMSNDERLATRIRSAAEAAGEPVWPLPLPREYEPYVHGDHTDLRNTSRVRGAGAITAGLFLKQFAGDTPWAHLDIAGPAFAERESLPYVPKGGTGSGVRTMLNFLLG